MKALDLSLLSMIGLFAIAFGTQPATKYAGAAVTVAAIAASVYLK